MMIRPQISGLIIWIYCEIFEFGKSLAKAGAVTALLHSRRPSQPNAFPFPKSEQSVNPVANGRASWWCIAATLREIRNSARSISIAVYARPSYIQRERSGRSP
ncbi:hypothetical protein [Inquilinus limosus]|uniref:hypothetical protein n=1 Tax=Inquilinus limosus TaxID=171674 RepID=UPI0012DE9099|nr:hypothetical protein [Inquilinus limosus]